MGGEGGGGGSQWNGWGIHVRVRRKDRKACASRHGVRKGVWWRKARFQSRSKCAFSRCQDMSFLSLLERFKFRNPSVPTGV